MLTGISRMDEAYTEWLEDQADAEMSMLGFEEAFEVEVEEAIALNVITVHPPSTLRGKDYTCDCCHSTVIAEGESIWWQKCFEVPGRRVWEGFCYRCEVEKEMANGDLVEWRTRVCRVDNREHEYNF
jgi:hypothetical protein